MTVALVMVAAAVGAPLRYVVDQAVQHRWPGAFPAGTLTVNLSGSFLLGLLTGLAARHGLAPQVVTVLGTGLLGAYTTFSTFSYETVRLLEDGAVARGRPRRRRQSGARPRCGRRRPRPRSPDLTSDPRRTRNRRANLIRA